VVGEAKRFAKEIAEGVKRASDLMGQLAMDALRQQRVRQVMKQTRARIYRGLPNSVGLAALPLRMTSVVGSNKLTILPSARVSLLSLSRLCGPWRALLGRYRARAVSRSGCGCAIWCRPRRRFW
jgi:hypothetical protein